MEIVTSWEREGIEKGIKIGEARGEREDRLEGKREGIKIGKQGRCIGLAFAEAAVLERSMTTLLREVIQLPHLNLSGMSDVLFGFTGQDDVVARLNRNQKNQRIKRDRYRQEAGGDRFNS